MDQLVIPRGEETMNRRYLRVFLFALSGVVFGCKDMGTEIPAQTVPVPPSGGTISFASDVLPILNDAGCTGCHGGNGGLTVATVPQLLAGGNHGPAIVPGNADSSNLVRKLLTPPPFGSRMPLGRSPLPDASIAVIKSWINQGAKNN
jgi:hypothetical protein